MAGKRSSLDVLRGVPLFEGLSRAELQHILGEMEEELFGRGETIVSEGQAGGRFYLITKGRAKVSIGGRARKPMGPGDYFGEIALIDGEVRSATVKAETDVVVLTLAPWNFLALLEENFKMTQKVMAMLCKRVRALERSLVD